MTRPILIAAFFALLALGCTKSDDQPDSTACTQELAKSVAGIYLDSQPAPVVGQKKTVEVIGVDCDHVKVFLLSERIEFTAAMTVTSTDPLQIHAVGDSAGATFDYTDSNHQIVINFIDDTGNPATFIGVR